VETIPVSFKTGAINHSATSPTVPLFAKRAWLRKARSRAAFC
jgi:hypothetical protein